MLQLGHSVQVVTFDDPRQPFIKEFPFPVHALGPVRSFYGYNRRLVPWLKAHAGEFDAVIVNGLWQYHSFGTWRALRGSGLPYYVFTHGMLDPWFKRAYPIKHLKKWLYWPWADYRVVRDARAVFFTSEEERLLARKSFWLYRAREYVVAYGTTPPPVNDGRMREQFLAAYPALRDRRVVLFLSRIHEKKGCDLLLHAFADVAAKDLGLELVIAGPDQTGWVERLQKLAEQLGIAQRVTWPGMLRGEMKWGAFYSAETFILPSHQENFGIAVAEALGCGVPVLISDKVNIWREVRAHGAGLVAPDTEAGTIRLLTEWLLLSPLQRSTMRHNALQLFNQRFTVDAMASGLLEAIQ